jgi:membrane-associated phospholipid phosphatase
VRRLRCSEWLLIAYFLYVAVTALLFGLGWRACILAGAVALLIWMLGRRQSLMRDLAPLAFSLAAYREMDWFTPAARNYRLEKSWIVWDRRLLDGWHLRAAIESAGAWLPFYLEACYTSLYVITPLSLVLLYLHGRRNAVDRFWMAALSATLLAYALFPYFPSAPPRTTFPGADLPAFVTAPRKLNLWLAGNFGIHSSVFPSAHVSAALGCAWGLLAVLTSRRWIAWGVAALGVFISVAAVYGRYHYALDVAAGMLVSLVAFLAVRLAAWVEKPD